MADSACLPASASDPAPPPDSDNAEGLSEMLMDSVTKDEWKTIEASLSYQKKAVAEMLKCACAQVRTKGELSLDDSNGKFLGDMLPEMEHFATWCYRVRPRAWWTKRAPTAYAKPSRSGARPTQADLAATGAARRSRRGPGQERL